MQFGVCQARIVKSVLLLSLKVNNTSIVSLFQFRLTPNTTMSTRVQSFVGGSQVAAGVTL